MSKKHVVAQKFFHFFKFRSWGNPHYLNMAPQTSPHALVTVFKYDGVELTESFDTPQLNARLTALSELMLISRARNEYIMSTIVFDFCAANDATLGD
jgi:hypothetical protein